MPGNRTLLPAPSALDGVLQSRQRTADKSIATNKAGAPGKKIAKQRRHRHSSREWEDLKERFAELYKDEDLPGVMKIIRQEFGFEARCVYLMFSLGAWWP